MRAAPAMRRIVALTATVIALTGCAGEARLESARGDFEAHTKPMQMMVQYDLADSAGLASNVRERREQEAARAFMPACTKPYTEKLLARVKAAAERATAIRSLNEVDSLPDVARGLDREFDKCVGKFGVIGFNYVELQDGREQRVPDYLAEVLDSLHRYGAAYDQAALEQQLVLTTVAALGAVGTAINSDQIYVGPYVRADGAPVRGHWRTKPNDTCLDNIRGCRAGQN